MSSAQRDDMTGREGANDPRSHMRARPHAKAITPSLSPPNGELSRKAVGVEWLLGWAYAREKVHLARPPGMPLLANVIGAGRDSTSHLGVGSGARNNMGFEAPPDAYAVMRAVDALDRSDAMLVRTYALMGGAARPDWTPMPVIRCEPGKNTGYALHIDKRKRRTLCPFRTFIYRGDLPEIVAERRRVYRQWAESVAQVHGMLQAGELQHHELTGELPPLAPWDGR